MHQLYALGCIRRVSAYSTEPTELGLRGTCLTVGWPNATALQLSI